MYEKKTHEKFYSLIQALSEKTNLENAQSDINKISELYTALHENNDIQSKIIEISFKILQSGATQKILEDSFNSIIQICQDAVHGDTSVIQLLDENNQNLIGVATDDKPYKPEGYFINPLIEQSLAGAAISQGNVVAIDDVKNDPRVNQRIRKIFSAVSGIATPLYIDGKVVGVLVAMAQNEKVHYTKRDISIMHEIGNVISLAMQTQKLQKQRVLAENRFQHLAEFAPSTILLIDQDMMIIEANASTEKLFGVHPKEVIDVPLNLLIGIPESWDAISLRLQTVESGVSIDFESEILNDDGKRIPVEFISNKLSISGDIVYQCFIRDITSRKSVEIALQEHQTNLEKTVRERTKDLVVAKNEAESANRMKSEFLANMSHELRTPLHAISSFSSMGFRKAHKLTVEKTSNYFEKIEQSAARLLSLVNNLLDLSKLESGQFVLNLEQWNFYDLVLHVVGEFELILVEKNISLTVDDVLVESSFMCDRIKVEQVIRNLISNAIKFTSNGKKIQVVIDDCDQNPEHVRFTVVDQGIGLPEDELETIFNKFTQSSRTNSGAGGTGLGLSISKNIVNKHGGKIYAVNNVTGGATFCCTFPRNL